MWGTAPRGDVVETGSGGRSSSRAPRVRRGQGTDRPLLLGLRQVPRAAEEANEIAERLGDPVIRSYGYDVHGLRAFAAGDYEEAVDWHRRRLSLVGEIGDPDHQADIYGNAIAPAVSRGEFDEACRYTASTRTSRADSRPSPSTARRLSQPRARGAPRQLGRRPPAAAAGGRRRGRKRRDAVRAKSALSARVRARSGAPRRRGGGPATRTRGGGPRHDRLRNRARHRACNSPFSAATWLPSNPRSASRRCGGRTGSPQLDGGPPGRARCSPRAGESGARGNPAHEARDVSRAPRFALGIVREDGSLVERAADRFAEARA